VDAVVVFDEATCNDRRRLQPDVLVKGADWAMDEIIGRQTVESRGGRSSGSSAKATDVGDKKGDRAA
jgi:bifunctional ADP-heptose synthase (sugar kinase/adenylyltransferase)